MWEWVFDYYGYYQSDLCDNCANTSASPQNRVARGGSWYRNVVYIRSASRVAFSPYYRDADYGFRCARAP